MKDKDLLTIAIADCELYSPTQRKVLLELIDSSPSGIVTINANYLQNVTNISIASVYVALKALKSNGILKATRVVNTYTFDKEQLERIVQLYLYKSKKLHNE